MKLIELNYKVLAKKVLIFFEDGTDSREFLSTGWGDDWANAIIKACKEFGDRHISNLYPLNRNELVITLK